MEKSQVHVIVGREWFDDMFIAGEYKSRKQETYEAFVACAANNEIVVIFSSGITLDDGFEFVYPRWAGDQERHDYSERFALLIEHSSDYLVSANKEYKDVFRIGALNIRSPYFVWLESDDLAFMESVLRKIIEVNPDVSNRYKDNHAVISHVMNMRKSGNAGIYNFSRYSDGYNVNKYKKEVSPKYFSDASMQVEKMMEKYSKNNMKIQNDALRKKDIYMKNWGWKGDIEDDGSSGYLNIKHAAENGNKQE
jgi:hypothetical protein